MFFPLWFITYNLRAKLYDVNSEILKYVSRSLRAAFKACMANEAECTNYEDRGNVYLVPATNAMVNNN